MQWAYQANGIGLANANCVPRQNGVGCTARLGWGAKLITQQNFAIFSTRAKFSKNGQNSPLAIFRCVINLSIRLFEIEGDV